MKGLVTRNKVDDDTYEVRCRGEVLGVVRYDRNAWSYRRWFIDGKPVARAHAGVGGKRLYKMGYGSLKDAVEEVAVMASGTILRILARQP